LYLENNVSHHQLKEGFSTQLGLTLFDRYDPLRSLDRCLMLFFDYEEYHFKQKIIVDFHDVEVTVGPFPD
jgi:hypothetical protein